MTSDPNQEELRRRAERARRRAQVFGEILPEGTRDDRPPPEPETGPPGSEPDADEEWLRANVPPHHGF